MLRFLFVSAFLMGALPLSLSLSLTEIEAEFDELILISRDVTARRF